MFKTPNNRLLAIFIITATPISAFSMFGFGSECHQIRVSNSEVPLFIRSLHPIAFTEDFVIINSGIKISVSSKCQPVPPPPSTNMLGVKENSSVHKWHVYFVQKW